MFLPQPQRVGYVFDQYPLSSEILRVKHKLAQETRLDIEIFTLHPPGKTHPHNPIALGHALGDDGRLTSQLRVKESLNTLPSAAASFFWAELQDAGKILPGFWNMLQTAQGETAETVYQATWLARKSRLKSITHLHTYFGSPTTRITCLAAHFASISYTLHSQR
ncbi:MAG: hypothetical protein QNJ46_29610 [Leptolyngbyaceae cyanobacterium MO_188.B28]|nr:hypothetical protein [Leptolyngbyaceae cyanobacterium MO_188.B28]